MIYRIRGTRNILFSKKNFVDLKPFYYRHHKTIEDGRQSLINSLNKTSLTRNQKDTKIKSQNCIDWQLRSVGWVDWYVDLLMLPVLRKTWSPSLTEMDWVGLEGVGRFYIQGCLILTELVGRVAVTKGET